MGQLEEGWNEYRQKVVPPKAGPVQVKETKRAFYAGAAAMFYTLILNATDKNSNKDLDVVEALHQELEAWFTGEGSPLKPQGTA